MLNSGQIIHPQFRKPNIHAALNLMRIEPAQQWEGICY